MKTTTTLFRTVGLFLLFLITTAGANAQNCNASFLYTVNGNTVVFQSTSTGVNNFTTFYWTYGDNGTGFGPTTTHQYTQSGNYVVCLTIADSSSGCFDQFCDSVTIGTTGIADQVLPVNVNATPNPFGDKLRVSYTLGQASPVTIRITDMFGKTVKEQVLEKQDAGAQFVEIDSALLASGSYLLQVESDFGKKVQLLIKN